MIEHLSDASKLDGYGYCKVIVDILQKVGNKPVRNVSKCEIWTQSGQLV